MTDRTKAIHETLNVFERTMYSGMVSATMTALVMLRSRAQTLNVLMRSLVPFLNGERDGGSLIAKHLTCSDTTRRQFMTVVLMKTHMARMAMGIENPELCYDSKEVQWDKALNSIFVRCAKQLYSNVYLFDDDLDSRQQLRNMREVKEFVRNAIDEEVSSAVPTPGPQSVAFEIDPQKLSGEDLLTNARYKQILKKLEARLQDFEAQIFQKMKLTQPNSSDVALSETKEDDKENSESSKCSSDQEDVSSTLALLERMRGGSNANYSRPTPSELSYMPDE